MSYSPQLVYFLDRLSGFSTNTFKLLPSGSRDVEPGAITRFTLPANALLNTRSFKCHFAASATGAGGRLPADISTLVERVEVSAGGVQISQGANYYNVLCNAKAAIMGSRCDSVTGHSEMVIKIGLTASDYGETNETYVTTNGRAPHVIDKWEGFSAPASPRFLMRRFFPILSSPFTGPHSRSALPSREQTVKPTLSPHQLEEPLQASISRIYLLLSKPLVLLIQYTTIWFHQ